MDKEKSKKKWTKIWIVVLFIITILSMFVVPELLFGIREIDCTIPDRCGMPNQ